MSHASAPHRRSVLGTQQPLAPDGARVFPFLLLPFVACASSSTMREETNPTWTSKVSPVVLDEAASGDSSGVSRRHLLP